MDKLVITEIVFSNTNNVCSCFIPSCPLGGPVSSYLYRMSKCAKHFKYVPDNINKIINGISEYEYIHKNKNSLYFCGCMTNNGLGDNVYKLFINKLMNCSNKQCANIYTYFLL